MADQSSQDTGLEELERLLENEENYCRMLALQPTSATGGAMETSSSSTNTTPGLLDTAFLNETNADDQHAQITLSAAQSQTTQAASSTVHRMIDTLVERQPEIIQGDKARTMMVSTGTMPRTPVEMVSFGTMPKTPRQQATTTRSFSVSDQETIDLCSPAVPVIDLVSPENETIDLCSPETPTNTDSPRLTPN